jgi:ribose transport system substrate-binding protein
MKSILCALIAAFMVAACGGMDDKTAPSDGVPQENTPAAASRFASSEIEGVMDSLVASIKARYTRLFPKPPVAMLLKSMTDFWQPVATGANRMSVRLTSPSVVEAPLIPDSTDSDLPQVLQDMYVQKYVNDAIYMGMAIAPIAPTAATVSWLNTFVQERGPVVTIDSDAPTSKRSYLIATANYPAGLTAAKTLRKFLDEGDTVAVFGTTDANWVSGIQRSQGAEDGARAAGLRVAPRIPVAWKNETDLASLVAALSDPSLDIKGLLCMFANSDLCAAAVEATGKKGTVKILGFDMTNATKVYFAQGYFCAIAVQRQYYMGALGILVPYGMQVLGAAETKAALQPILINDYLIDTGLDIITPDNFSDYMDYLNEMGINM